MLTALALAALALLPCAAAAALRNATAAAGAPSFLAVGPSAAAGSFDLFSLSAGGQKTKVLLSFPVAAAEVAQDGAFGCGRGYCLLLTQLPAARQTLVRNFSFFPPAALLAKYTLPYLLYNLNTNAAENDDDFYGVTIIQDHATTPASWVVATIGDGGRTTRVLDITGAVGPTGSIAQGATAYCGAGLSTLFVAVSRRGAGAGDTDTLLTIDLAGGAPPRVRSALALDMPVLASHFATCGGAEGALSVGGAMVVSSGLGRHAIVVGSLDLATGAFQAIDAADLPPAAGPAPLDVSPIMAGVSPFSQSYAAVLYSGLNALPGYLFVSHPAAGRGTATLAPLEALVYGLAEAF